MKITTIVGAVAAVAVAATPAALSAQLSFGECAAAGVGGSCFGARVNFVAPTTLQVDLQNTSTGAAGGRITGFALYDVVSPFLQLNQGGASTISASFWNGTSFQTLTNFVTQGDVPGLIPGSFPTELVYQFANDDGITACGVTGLGSGTNQPTCGSSGQYVRFTITTVGSNPTSTDFLEGVNLAVRFQSTGTSGNGSIKCYTSSGAAAVSGDDCTPRTPGIVTGSVVPEPSTYALLATGLGVIGFVARRRRQTV